MRKDLYPLEWIEVIKNGELYFKYCPQLKKYTSDNIYKELYKNKKDGFKKHIIDERLKETNYRCEITELPLSEGKLAADHFIPKEKGGNSDKNNCIILNKVLNEKKNNHYPIEWFCNTLLSNFMNICKKVGMLEECKSKLIEFITKF